MIIKQIPLESNVFIKNIFAIDDNNENFKLFNMLIKNYISTKDYIDKLIVKKFIKKLLFLYIKCQIKRLIWVYNNIFNYLKDDYIINIYRLFHNKRILESQTEINYSLNNLIGLRRDYVNIVDNLKLRNIPKSTVTSILNLFNNSSLNFYLHVYEIVYIDIIGKRINDNENIVIQLQHPFLNRKFINIFGDDEIIHNNIPVNEDILKTELELMHGLLIRKTFTYDNTTKLISSNYFHI